MDKSKFEDHLHRIGNMAVRHALQFVKRQFVVFVFGALLVAPNVMAIQTTKFFPGFDENEDFEAELSAVLDRLSAEQ